MYGSRERTNDKEMDKEPFSIVWLIKNVQFFSVFCFVTRYARVNFGAMEEEDDYGYNDLFDECVFDVFATLAFYRCSLFIGVRLFSLSSLLLWG